PTVPPGTALAGVLDGAVSEHDGCVAAVQESARLGRVCRVDLCDRVVVVLVRRTDSGSCDAARPVAIACGPHRLRHAGNGLARLRPALAPLRHGLSPAGRTGDAACRVGTHSREL